MSVYEDMLNRARRRCEGDSEIEGDHDTHAEVQRDSQILQGLSQSFSAFQWAFLGIEPSAKLDSAGGARFESRLKANRNRFTLWRTCALTASLSLLTLSAILGVREFQGTEVEPSRESTVYSLSLSPLRAQADDAPGETQYKLQVDNPTSGIAYVIAIHAEQASLLQGGMILPRQNSYLLDVESGAVEYYLLVIIGSPSFLRSDIEQRLREVTASPGNWEAAIDGVIRPIVSRYSLTRFRLPEHGQ